MTLAVGAASYQDGRSEGSYLRRNGDQQMGDSDGLSTLMHASLIEIFGQRDGTRRRDAMRRTYAENTAFTDPEGTVHGYDSVDQRVRKILDDAGPARGRSPAPDPAGRTL
jgi:hypothetical protein